EVEGGVELEGRRVSCRRRHVISSEEGDAVHRNTRSERDYWVESVAVAAVLGAEFIRQSTAEKVRFAENDGVVSNSYIVSPRGRDEAADADVILAVVRQTISEEDEILLA